MEKRLRIVDLNELDSITMRSANGLDIILLEDLMELLSSPDYTKEVMGDVYDAGFNAVYTGHLYEKEKSDHLNNLIQ